MISMNLIAQQKLVELIKRFGSDVAWDPRRCEALLRDFCGDQHRREVHVLICAVRDGIASEFVSEGGGIPITVLLARLSSRLHNNYGIAEPLAQWAVQSWALALGVVCFNESEALADRAGAANAQIERSPAMGCEKTADYLVIDLSAGPTASSYQVSYLKAVPTGGWTDEYKTTKMLFRRIPVGTFMMGSPEHELGRDGLETQHKVTLSKPFFIGVFEITQTQWERIMGTWPSFFDNASCRDARPVEGVSYNDIRGSNLGAQWPSNNSVDSVSFMGRLRARTGKAFDLPTESQWEYAGRAGTPTALNSGNNLTDKDNCLNMAEVGRYYYNGGTDSRFNQHGDTSVGTAKVGSYPPNTWGLYDIHGNVWEWCLDLYGTYPGTVNDPLGSSLESFRARTSGSLYRMLRGGSWAYRAYRGRGGFRFFLNPDAACHEYGIGFRIALPAGQ